MKPHRRDTDDMLAGVLARGYELDWDERFDGPGLDRSRWLPHHLPQWSSRTQAAARYELAGGRLHLQIEAGQQPWCPEYDGETRVSSLQTGVFSGPAGSTVGQHRFDAAAVVREEQESARLYTPQYGVVVLRARGVTDPDSMVALWMIGYEDRPEQSAEICVCEIFGRDVAPGAASIGMGVHPFGDPAIVDDFERVRVPVDVREPHEYAAEWTSDHVTFYVDGRSVRRVRQSPAYPMQLMLGVYRFVGSPPVSGYPVRFTVDGLRVYRPRR
jgi:hypothetical protein